MSNQQVGAVYEHVIKEVCQASQIDFEEGGVDQQTLKELQKVWQEKVSSLNVATFPWDPPPTTIPSNAPAPTPTPPQQQQQQVPQQQQPSQQQQQQQQQPQQQQQQTSTQLPPVATPSVQSAQVPAANGSSNGTAEQPQVKSEPGYGDSVSGLPPMTSLPPMSAQQRAANNLREKFGPAAQNQVNQLQAQSQGLAFPGQQNQQDEKPTNLQDPSQPGNSNLGNAQTDGASDALAEWKAEVSRRRQAAQQQEGAGDRLLRDQMKRLALQREGGGDMVPYDERYGSSNPGGSRITLTTGSTAGQIGAQYDGNEDDDEDAINSDLDDPDDLGPEDPDGEESVGQVMLCTYDKVQRVKNKWKCTLKDGTLTTGGREYVFHKGQGEFEW